MKFKTVKQLRNIPNRVYLVKNIEEIKSFLTPKTYHYFRKKWRDKDFQHISNFDGHTFVIRYKKNKPEQLRRFAHRVHEIVKDELRLGVFSKFEGSAIAFLEGLYMSHYQFLKYFKDAQKKEYNLKRIEVAGVSSERLEEFTRVMESQTWARDLINEPVSYLTAEELAQNILNHGTMHGYKVEILKKRKIESLKMGGLLAVNKGSENPPTFTIIEYNPPQAKNKKPVVLVGKGVVYDTGGLSLKPTPHSMDLMKSDMSGAATVAAAIDALAKNNVQIHVIGLIPATDNRPGKNAYAPGDVIEMFDGTTVEVLNTDAEGRMILADALAYANKYEPELVIDVATLTGAALRALGTRTAIYMGNAPGKIMRKLDSASEESGDKIYPFPFWDEWKEELKSDIADLKNIGGPTAGMITAGKFLEHFVKYPYIHIDIAGPAFLESPDSYRGKGATGYGVRLLYEFLKKI